MPLSDWALAATTGVLVTVAHPPLAWGLVAWVALAPLLVALDGKTGAQRCLLGLVAGLLCSWGLVGYWLVGALQQVPLSLVSAAVLTQVSISVGGVAGFAAFAWFSGAWRPPLPAVLWMPAGWVLIEYLRANVAGGIPWCLLGHSQHAAPAVIQIADLAGVYGVSFVVCAASVAIASWWLDTPRCGLELAAAGIMVVLTLGYGAARLSGSDATADAVAVQAVHPHWPAGLGEAPERRLEDLIRLSVEAPRDPAALLVWPENALRFDLGDGNPLSERFTAFVQERRQYTVAGVHRHEREGGAVRYYNSAVLVAAEGSVVGVADKRILVPVAETRWRLLPAVEPSFSEGKAWVPLAAGRRTIGVLLCFESIFPEPARALVRQGATLFVNPTNDEILGDGAAQLAAMSVFRSVETGVPLVHAGTAGVTQIVDANGRVVAAESARPRVVTATVSARRGGTWYSVVGDAFALGCAALLAIAALYARLEQ